ncbi:MAG: hypothetical protein VX938_03845, partial [Myxococcota bacterium]|nr:hypothetical protein [Myxococcota bacterium]
MRGAIAPRWGASLVLLLMLGFVSPTMAAQVLPVEAQGKLMKALRPTVPGGEISGGWRLGDVQLAQDRVTIRLVSGEQGSTLSLLPLGEATAGEGISLGETRSFRAWLQAPSPAPAALRAAAQILVDRVGATDQGYYKTTAEEAPVPTGGATPVPAPAIPVSWTLALGLLLLLVSAAWSLRER